MPRYEVKWATYTHHSMTVEADNKKQAEKIMEMMWNNGHAREALCSEGIISTEPTYQPVFFNAFEVEPSGKGGD